MEEVESTPGEDTPPSAAETPAPETAPAPALAVNFDHVRGFQALPPETPPADAEAYAAELVKELAARAERFRQSVDDSIVLASDGVIRWLGDPVGRLVAGDDVLKPRAVLLADETLPAESREAVETRLGLWIAAHVRKVLGPLEALAEPAPDLSEGAREVARRVAEALGVLDRERVRNQVKGLDQNARAALRKLGVRFGASYIFVPALLKPAPRTLSMQLWSLRRGVEVGADRLLSYAAAGRTSFANEGSLSPDAYRVAGFRLCGERVVRVDIVERLTDLIRAAIPHQMRPGDRGPEDASGFLVTPQMTSLTGCAGEAFAAILRSLGYESHQVKKADWEAANRKPEPAKVEPAAPPAEAEAEAAEPAAESAGAPEIMAETSAEPVAAEAEPVTEAASDEAAVASETAAPEAAPETAAPEAAPEPETPDEAPTEIAEAPSEAPPADEPVAVAPVAEAADEASAAVEATDSVPPAAETADEAAVPAEEEMIEVWRLAPRRRAPPPRPAAEPGQRPAWRGRDRDQRRSQGPRTEPVAAAPAAPAPVEGEAAPAPAPVDSGRPERRPHQGQPWRDRDGGKGRGGFKGAPREDRGPRPDKGAAPPPPPRKEPRPQQVDMDSPFAKLLALKPLLSRRDERT